MRQLRLKLKLLFSNYLVNRLDVGGPKRNKRRWATRKERSQK